MIKLKEMNRYEIIEAFRDETSTETVKVYVYYMFDSSRRYAVHGDSVVFETVDPVQVGCFLSDLSVRDSYEWGGVINDKYSFIDSVLRIKY